ncbi:BLUF domain-containing protein [Maricaulis sp.]|uniref:BLUF domain-containing protein n=1 Tax=Maricaulis sp. TaxID=1486257 RepID=UPI00260645A5|nr:BLUF domain-containing protein [Maricaulis sp.]
MYLTRLLYCSERNAEVDLDIEQLLYSARDYNGRSNITGALWFDGTYFVQVLEGGRQVVSETYHRIAKDPRHHSIEIVSCEMVDARLFHQWRMAYFADTADNRSLVLKYSGQDKLIPSNMSSASLLHVLAEGNLLGD